MSDKFSKEKRSWIMTQVHSSNTSIEVRVRKWLFGQGFRFRKNVRSLPGTPDIVLPKYKTVLFVHGCYWHRHPGCSRATTPASNTAFWNAKFTRNVENDKKHIDALVALGWKPIVIWECELKKTIFQNTMERVKTEILSSYNQVIQENK